MTETLTITVTLPYSIYTTTLDSGQILTVQSVTTTGDIILMRLLVTVIALLLLNFVFILAYRR
jgi:hypothetical protein